MERAPFCTVLNGQDDKLSRVVINAVVNEVRIPANRDLSLGIGRLQTSSIRRIRDGLQPDQNGGPDPFGPDGAAWAR